MAARILGVTVAVVALLSMPAEARFGKGGSSSSSSSGHSSSSHSSGGSSTSHGAAPVSHGSSSSSSGGSSGSYSGGYGSGYSSYDSGYGYGYRPYRDGFYSGYFVPSYGYGYGSYWATPGPVYAASAAPAVVQEPSDVRVTASGEAQLMTRTNTGMSLGVAATFEGERWGFSATGYAISLLADDGSGQTDTIQQLNLHLTYAFLTGRYGRLRVEVGADTVFAQDLVAMGPTGGLSGTLWIGGPFAIEGAVSMTPFPYKQLDYRANLAVGLGALGLRAGWRTQVLDDQGLVDGVVHVDTFQGPFAGLAFVF